MIRKVPLELAGPRLRGLQALLSARARGFEGLQSGCMLLAERLQSGFTLFELRRQMSGPLIERVTQGRGALFELAPRADQFACDSVRAAPGLSELGFELDARRLDRTRFLFLI